MSQGYDRRDFLRTAAILTGATALPSRAQNLPANKRLEWQTFKTTPRYSSLIAGIKKMKANTNSADPGSWSYWTRIHVNTCPHGIAYFLGWHRGYLHYFEKYLRSASGDSMLVLPYWDYYTYPRIPSEFTDPSSDNPLYVPRTNTNVFQALTMSPFSATVKNFQRGTANAFEPNLESAPHNPVHDIIGSVMTTMQSPVDPIFWLHHANIDRLWVAWMAAGGGRTMPPANSSYWSGNYSFNSTLAMQRKLTYDTRTYLKYMYENERMPSKLPQISEAPRLRLAQADNNIMPPPLGTFIITGPRAIGTNRFSVGGANNVGLNEKSVSVQLPIASMHGQTISKIARGVPAGVPGSGALYKSVQIVLDGVEITSTGQSGGYFYRIYLNLPGSRPNGLGSKEIGTLGPFQVAGATHHAGAHAQLRYPVTRFLHSLTEIQIGMLSVSFVRINGDNSPAGPTIGMHEIRIELSEEEPG